jgi:hypothetical protein
MTVSCSPDKVAAWRKTVGRKAVYLDTSCWINLRDEKKRSHCEVKAILRRLVSEGRVLCPLSAALIWELYKQEADSRLRTAALMDELSLGLTYANNYEIFAWEIERFVSRFLGFGEIDMTQSGLYVPVLGYLSSQSHIAFPAEFARDMTNEEFIRQIRQKINSTTLTELIQMRLNDEEDRVGRCFQRLAPPTVSARIALLRENAHKKDKQLKKDALFLVEFYHVLKTEIYPAVKDRLPSEVVLRFAEHLRTMDALMSENESSIGRGAKCLKETLKLLPALYNHVELLTTIIPNKTNGLINDFFDQEHMPVPLAYATVFAAEDKGIKYVLQGAGKQSRVLERTSCKFYCNLESLLDWLKDESNLE